MDGDLHSIQEIQDAISELEKMDLVVRATVFAPPGRATNPKWKKFLKTSGITFHPVERIASHAGEANDDAIVKVLKTCTDTQSFALLISDFDFLDVIRQAVAKNKQILVFIPTKRRVVIEHYRTVGVPVYELRSRVNRFPKVKAILRQNGEGHVQLSEAVQPYDNAEQISTCRSFLEDLGFVAKGSREHLVHGSAKFWLTNKLGSLTVFPQQIGVEEVHQILRDHGGRKWQKYSCGMAFLLPKTSPGRPGKNLLRKFGSSLARQFFYGGGPFMLQDSKNLVTRALTRLGYLDKDMNADLLEAMLVFVNAPANQFALRKQTDALPTLQDTAAEVEEKLRHAFLSHLTDGQWRIAPKDVQVRQLLHKCGLLSTAKAARTEVFRAMRRYAKQHHLPEMRTYNGLLLRILYSLSTSPCKTGTVEIRT